MPLPRLNPKRYTLNALKGFTLIELLVVISIIAILMAVASVSYLNAQQKGRDNKRKTDLKAVQQALEIYFNQNAKYPIANTGGIKCNTGDSTPANGDNTGYTWGQTFKCDPDGTIGSQAPITYMNPLPKDPVFYGDNTKYYLYSPSGTTSYVLYATLENSTKDQESRYNATASQPPPCNNISGHTWPNANYNFCVVNP